MDISVMLERVNGNGFRATALMPTALMTEAQTREEALDRIQTLISEKLSQAEVVQVHVPAVAGPNPWLSIAGTWRDHPDMDEVVANIEEYRRETNADPTRL
jgi:hypothetical protein